MSNKVWVLILSRLLLPELKGRRRGWWPYHTPESSDWEDTWGSFRDSRSPRGAQVGRRVAPQPGGSGWPMTRSFARVNTLPAGELTRLPLSPPPPCRRSRVQLWRGARRSREDTHARGSASPAQRVHQLAPTSRTHLAGALAHLPASRRRRVPPRRRGWRGGGSLVLARAGFRRGAREGLSGARSPQLPEQTSCEAGQGPASASFPESGRASLEAAGGRRVLIVGPPGVGRRAL